MTDLGLATEYENGVADVLAFLAGDSAVVTRDVKLPGRLSKSRRQVDVLVRGCIDRRANATLIVDCKRWSKRVNVSHAGAFLDLVKDVGAGFGLLVTTKGASQAARTRLRSAGGARIDVMTLEELAAWRPTGTVNTSYRVPREYLETAARALRRAGFRVMPEHDARVTDDEVCLCAFRHYGTTNPPDDVQREAWLRAAEAFAKVGLNQPDMLSHGVTVGGGTPAHRWLEVAVDGVPVGLKILAATEADVAEQLEGFRFLPRQSGLPEATFDVIRPDGWPIARLFGA